MGDGCVNSGDGVQLLLHLPNLLTGGADSQVFARPGGGDAGYLLSGVDVDAGAVEVAENLDGAVASLA